MKKTVLIAMLFILMVCEGVFAMESACNSKGSAFIPHIRYRQQTSTNIYWNVINLSNISESDVTVTVKLYDHTGGRDARRLTIHAGSTTDTNLNILQTGVETFTIPAGETRMVQAFKAGDYFAGYGIVEWCSTNERIGKALIGTVRHFGIEDSAGSYGGEYVLNGGQPF